MKLHGRSWVAAIGLLVMSLGTGDFPGLAYAAFPDRPIRLIVPFPPGGSNDVLGRYLSIKLTDRLGQQIVVDNRGGANGIIGADLAAKAAADGYTVLMVSLSWVMNAALRPLPYDIEKSFDPIGTLGSFPNSIVVYPGWGVTSVKELVARARAKPGAIFYASTGTGGFNHFGGELFNKVAKIELSVVQYKGGGPAMTDVIAGQVPVMFSSITQVLPHVRSQRLKVIAIGASKRSPVVPEIPTVIESGFPGYEMYGWWGFAAPRGIPRPVQDRLIQEFNTVLQDPETKKRLLTDAAEPLIMTPAEMRKMISADLKKWRDVAVTAGIKVQ
jgi:tripartite-type tricarboxylate transporter receptor subunit TctC